MAFYEFGVAVSGMFTAKTALSVTTNNVANASTKGYSRLVTNISATTPLKSMNSVGMVGTGSTVDSVTQMRSFYLDKKYWNQESKNGEYSVKNDQLDVLETILNELSEVGVTNDLNNLFNSLSEVSIYADDDSYRTSVITQAETLATDINTIAQNLLSQQLSINDEVSAVVSKINALGKQISSLTEEIYTYEMGSGNEASSMRDERNNLIDELSSFVNIEVKEIQGNTGVENDKKFYVLINGQEFVNHFSFNPLKTVARDENVNSEDYPYLYDVFFTNNEALNVDELSGQLGALLQIRDGNSEVIGSTFSGDYVDTPRLTVTNLNGLATINTGASSTGAYRYHLNIENANSITFKGYLEDDAPDGVSAYDNNGNIIYQAGSSGNQTETTIASLTLNPQYSKADGTYDITINVDIDNKTASVTYSYTDEDGNPQTATEAVDISGIKTLSYLNINGNEDLNIKGATAKQYAVAQVYTNYNGIPYYMSKLNKFAQTFSRAINLGEYSDGTKIDGITGHYYAYDKDGETGNLFFSYRDDEGNIQTGDIDYDKITALNFSISQELYDSPRNFAASTTDTIGTTADASNNIAAIGYLGIKDEETLFQEGGIYNYVNAVAARLGIDNSQSYKYSEYYESIATTIDNQRLSVSSVSINEEMTNLVQYQHLFIASSQMINTINEIYNTLINGTF